MTPFPMTPFPEIGHALKLEHVIKKVRVRHRLMTDLGTIYGGDKLDSKRFSATEESTIKSSDFYVPIR
jgi:hypothetical protein